MGRYRIDLETGKATYAIVQAEDEIAACSFAIGASYAGKCAVTITSGPGYSLKQEAIGLAVMGEIPLVVVNVQRGGPSTGQPTKAEQGDLLTAIFGSHGDAPKVVMASSPNLVRISLSACSMDFCFSLLSALATETVFSIFSFSKLMRIFWQVLRGSFVSLAISLK